MATWGVHIRVAEKLLKMNFDFDKEAFTVGNLGPDCNKANEDWTEFDPPQKVTHWVTEDKKIDADRFFDTYLRTNYQDKKKESFLIGYYAHLLSDIEWSKLVEHKKRTSCLYDQLNIDKDFIWEIKKDWYDLDHLYFRKNSDSFFHTSLKYLKEFPEYIEYFPKNSVINKLEYIINFYVSFEGNLDREYKYLTEDEMNLFVNRTADLISNIFIKKGF
ncbi:hypothetical protein [Brassicibacter mesophilus]|uniref:hypothetical protein n=1 Tax=Brassicibacter mesophilus TaxID=745119 RepID=UPI003D20278A